MDHRYRELYTAARYSLLSAVRWNTATLVAFSLLGCMSGCSHSPEDIVREFENAHNDQNIEQMLELVSEDVAFEISDGWAIEGKGQFRVYAEWDAAVNSLFRFDSLSASGDTITGRLIETNDWFDLMGVKAVIYDSVGVIVVDGRISEIRASQKDSNRLRTRSTFESFIRWAADERSSELVGLMDGPSFVFRKKNAARWLGLLEEWHLSTLEPPKQSIGLSVQYVHADRVLITDQTIRFRNLTQRPIHQIAFNKRWDPIQPYYVTVDGSTAHPIAVFQQNVINVPVMFDLAKPILPGQETVIEVVSRIDLDIAAILRESTSHTLVDWFPRIWWGKRIETHADYTLQTSGFPGLKAIPAVLSSTSDELIRSKSVRSYALLIGANSAIGMDESGNPAVQTVFPATDNVNRGAIVISVRDAVNFMERHIGLFPFRTVTIIPNIVPELQTNLPTGLLSAKTLLVKGAKRRNLQRWFTAHRIAEHYIGEMAMPAPGAEWITRGLSLYLAERFAESRSLRSDDAHALLIDLYLEAVRRGLDTTIETPNRLAPETTMDRSLVIDYGKGYAIISALSIIMGSDRMDHILRGVYRTHSGDRIDLFEFKKICERVSGVGLEWFFDQWIRTNSFLSYNLDDVESEFVGGRYLTTAEVVRTGSIRMPIPVAAHFEDGSVQVKFTNRGLDIDIVTFESISPLSEIEIDPDNRLPMLKSENYNLES